MRPDQGSLCTYGHAASQPDADLIGDFGTDSYNIWTYVRALVEAEYFIIPGLKLGKIQQFYVLSVPFPSMPNIA